METERCGVYIDTICAYLYGEYISGHLVCDRKKNTDVFGNATILTLVNPARICYLYLIGKQDVETLLETMPYRVEETRGCT